MNADLLDSEPVLHQHSGWLLPLGVFVITAALSAGVLAYYLLPRPAFFFHEQALPSAVTDRVSLTVHDINFSIPANYLEFKKARAGGEQKEVALFALMPAMTGFTPADADRFRSNDPDSDLIYILVREDALGLGEAERFRRIYLSYVENPAGERGPYGLTQYGFRGNSGYGDQDLFVGKTSSGPVVLRCVRASDSVPSPSCLRDQTLSTGVSISYRFKRAHLDRWREIGADVDRLIKRFEVAK